MPGSHSRLVPCGGVAGGGGAAPAPSPPPAHARMEVAVNSEGGEGTRPGAGPAGVAADAPVDAGGVAVLDAGAEGCCAGGGATATAAGPMWCRCWRRLAENHLCSVAFLCAGSKPFAVLVKSVWLQRKMAVYWMRNHQATSLYLPAVSYLRFFEMGG